MSRTESVRNLYAEKKAGEGDNIHAEYREYKLPS
jgi:hypothetical protein